MDDKVHDQILESVNNIAVNNKEYDNNQMNIDTMASLNFRINEYLDEIIKLKTMLTQKNMENDQLRGPRRNRNVERESGNVKSNIDNEIVYKKTDEEI